MKLSRNILFSEKLLNDSDKILQKYIRLSIPHNYHILIKNTNTKKCREVTNINGELNGNKFYRIAVKNGRKPNRWA